MNALFLNVLGDWVSFGTIYYCLISNYIYRGDHIVPNFEEIWPSGKTKEIKKGKFDMDYLTDAMNKGIPGERNKDFTTCGKPKVSFFYNSLLHFSKLSHEICRLLNRNTMYSQN